MIIGEFPVQNFRKLFKAQRTTENSPTDTTSVGQDNIETKNPQGGDKQFEIHKAVNKFRIKGLELTVVIQR